jgi:hypothetical protein
LALALERYPFALQPRSFGRSALLLGALLCEHAIRKSLR